jgi:RNA polymerase sigma factor (sigma-70 family)
LISLAFQKSIFDEDCSKTKLAKVLLYGEYFFYIALYSLPSNLKYLAMDITQEVFLGAFRNFYRFDEDLGNTLEQWLFGIYKNCRVDALIRNSRQSGRYPTNRINDSEKKTDLKAFSEERLMRTAIFQKRLDKLEDLDRTIIAMNIEGMTSIEIASYTGLSPAAVRKRIERATKILKGEKRTDEAKG